MTLARAQQSNNIIIGAGEFFVDILDASGSPQGERYVGDTVAGTLDVQTETVTVYSGDGPSADRLAETVTQVRRTLQITMHDIQAPNLALFTGGDAGTQADAANAVADESHTVKLGHWYQLGKSTVAKPGGVVAVNAVGFTVTSDAAAPVTIDAANYVLDAANGRLFIKADAAAISDGDTILVDYTPVARTVKTVTAAKKQVKAAIRYIEDAANGKGNNYYAPYCNVRASGAMNLKSRDNEEQLQISCEMLDPLAAGMPQLYINGQSA